MLVKKIRITVSFFLLIGVSISLYSQNGKKVNVLFEKNIYNTFDGYPASYSAEGYVIKSLFEENQNLTFRTEHPVDYNRILRDTIISGRYFTTPDGNSYIEGIWKDFNVEYRKIIRIKGIFKISNNLNGIGINTNKKKGDLLNIHILPEKKYQVNITTGLFKLVSDIHSIEELLLKHNISKHYNSKYVYPIIFKEILNDKNVEIKFKNKDTFKGKVIENFDSESYNYIPDNGEYQYATGEILKGKIFMWDKKFLIDKGTTTFIDGSTSYDKWLDNLYGITGFDADELIKSSETLTELRDRAKAIFEEKKRKKENTEKLKLEKSQKQLERKKDLIKKYGNEFGDKLSQGELLVGMSENMVNEVWKKEYFTISNIARNGQMIEIWEFDKFKFQQEIIREGERNKINGGEDAAKALLLFELSKQLGGDSLNNPKTLVFKNKILIEIYR